MTQKPETTLVVTDSGLGGMSVFAGLVQGLARGSEYSRINLVYVNAWPRQHKGYNHYPDMAARARVFHNALTAMAGFRPDQILIACNTLSVIYPHTQFSAQTLIPVTGIVEKRGGDDPTRAGPGSPEPGRDLRHPDHSGPGHP